MKTIIFFTFLCMSFYSHAQLANASLFSEMKAINPAVISERSSGIMTLSGSMLEATKDQDIDGEDQKLEISIKDFTFFRGGKGKGFNSEITIKRADGDTKRTSESAGVEKTQASLTYFNYSMSLGNIGFGFFYNKFEYRSDENTQTSLDQIVTIYDFKLGYKTVALGLNLGLIAEVGFASIDLPEDEEESPGQVVADDDPGSIKPMFILGAAIGYRGKHSHYELGIETPLTSSEGEPDSETGEAESVRSARISATAEFKVYGITLGYTGRAYLNGFIDQELILNNRLIFITQESMRLEHNINFSLGGSSGLSISGSASISETQGEEPKSIVDPKELTYDTTTKLLVVSAKIGYAW